MNTLMSGTPKEIRVAYAIADANEQWEQENNRLNKETAWTADHVMLLARAAILAAEQND